MFFFSKLISKTDFGIKSPLQVHSHTSVICPLAEKRTSQSASYEGSMTVEASIVLPILLTAFVGLLMWGKIFVLSQEVDMALLETARQIARKEYLFTAKEEEGSSIFLTRTLFTNVRKEGDFTEGVEVSAFDFSESEYIEETGEVSLVVKYRVKIPLLLLGTWKVSLQSAVRQKAWNGYRPSISEQLQESDYVYITEDGEVYHKDSQCYHLHVTIHEVYNVDAYYDGKTSYDACSFCVEKDNRKKELFITDEGDCYHEDISCSGLTRRVRVVKLEEGIGRRPCKECGY